VVRLLDMFGNTPQDILARVACRLYPSSRASAQSKNPLTFLPFAQDTRPATAEPASDCTNGGRVWEALREFLSQRRAAIVETASVFSPQLARAQPSGGPPTLSRFFAQASALYACLVAPAAVRSAYFQELPEARFFLRAASEKNGAATNAAEANGNGDGDGDDDLLPTVTGAIHTSLRGVDSYSHACCDAALAEALLAYQARLPEAYPLHIHMNHILKGLVALNAVARGPLYHLTLERFQQEATALWRNGRQLCEQRSVSGLPCKLLAHRSPTVDWVATEHEASLPLCPHQSGYSPLCACVCGQTQLPVEDPFHAEQINAFLVELPCCLAGLTAVKYVPAVHVSAAAALHQAMEPLAWGPKDAVSGGGEEDPASSGLQQAEPPTAATLSGDFSRLMSGNDASPAQDMRSRVELPLQKPQACFAFYRFGSAQDYNATLGLAGAQGFLPGTPYLLPWEVPINLQRARAHDANVGAAGSVGGNGGGGGVAWQRGRHTHRGAASTPISKARVLVGYEYESASGKRFLAAGPEQVVRLGSSGYVKVSLPERRRRIEDAVGPHPNERVYACARECSGHSGGSCERRNASAGSRADRAEADGKSHGWIPPRVHTRTRAHTKACTFHKTRYDSR
jgi:hypothetical protein